MRVSRIGSIVALWLPLAAVAETPQDFSGEWVIAKPDAQARSNVAPSPTPSYRGAHGGGEGIGGSAGHGGHGSGRHHGSSVGAASSPAAADSALAPRSAARALTIRQSDVVFDIAADGGSRSVYRFDNRNNYGPAYGGTVTLTWATPEMIIETHPDSGGDVEEHYTLSKDGQRLTQHTHEQRAGADAARDITRVFVRSGSADAASTLP